MPFLLKDLACHSAGDPMHEGMGFLKRIGWVEEEDTWLARRFREAGFVFLGKTNTPELGILPTTESTAYGPARNPWDTDALDRRLERRLRRGGGGRHGARSPTRATAAARSGFRRPAAAWSA